MAQKGKSIVDKALLEAQEIDKAFEANAKEILTKTMGSEIEEMVRESLEGSNGLNEEDYDMEELEVSDDIDAEEGEEMELDLDMDLEDMEGDNEEDMDIDLDLDVDDESGLDMEDEIETIDLTGAEDSEVITVFKKMGPEDEIEVVQDGDSVDIKDNETGAEYRVEFGGESEMDNMDMEMEMDDMDMEMEMDDMDMEMDFEDEDDMDMEMDDMDMEMDFEDEDDMDDDMSENVVYEIEIDEEDDMDYMDEDMDEDEDDEEMDEASRTLGSGRRFGKKGLNKPKAAPRHLRQESTRRNSKLIKENKVLNNKVSDLNSEKEQLKEDYNKLVGILKNFRTKLDEVAVFNSNLAHAVSLFTENTTTKQEKIDILKRLDSAKTIKESKSVYRQLKKEVATKKPVRESLNDKINESKNSGSKTQISESKVYVHPEIENMKKLWSYNYKK